MKNIRVFLSENFIFLVVKFSVYLNRLVFLMPQETTKKQLKESRIDSICSTHIFRAQFAKSLKYIVK